MYVQFSLLMIGLGVGRSQVSSGHFWVKCNAQTCFTYLATLRGPSLRDKLDIGVGGRKTKTDPEKRSYRNFGLAVTWDCEYYHWLPKPS